MASLNFNVVIDENKLVTQMGSHSSLGEEFLPQSRNVAFDATIDALVIEFDQKKFEEFLCNNSISPTKLKTNSFRMARKIGVQSPPTRGVCSSNDAVQSTITDGIDQASRPCSLNPR